jgi:hypothetical protein
MMASKIDKNAPIDWDFEASRVLLMSAPSDVGYASPREFATANAFYTDGGSRSVTFMRDHGLPTDEESRRALWMALRRALNLSELELEFK